MPCYVEVELRAVAIQGMDWYTLYNMREMYTDVYTIQSIIYTRTSFINYTSDSSGGIEPPLISQLANECIKYCYRNKARNLHVFEIDWKLDTIPTSWFLLYLLGTASVSLSAVVTVAYIYPRPCFCIRRESFPNSVPKWTSLQLLHIRLNVERETIPSFLPSNANESNVYVIPFGNSCSV